MATMTTGGKKYVERKNVQKLSPNLKLEDMEDGGLFSICETQHVTGFHLLVCMHENVKAINLRGSSGGGGIFKQGKATLNSVCRLGCAYLGDVQGEDKHTITITFVFHADIYFKSCTHAHTH